MSVQDELKKRSILLLGKSKPANGGKNAVRIYV